MKNYWLLFILSIFLILSCTKEEEEDNCGRTYTERLHKNWKFNYLLWESSFPNENDVDSICGAFNIYLTDDSTFTYFYEHLLIIEDHIQNTIDSVWYEESGTFNYEFCSRISSVGLSAQGDSRKGEIFFTPELGEPYSFSFETNATIGLFIRNRAEGNGWFGDGFGMEGYFCMFE
jgi:hypothetical protein